MKLWKTIALLLAFACLFAAAGCGAKPESAPEASATPTATATPEPTATPRPTPTATPEPMFTNPLTGERIQALEQTYKAAPSWNAPIDPALELRFERVKAKLSGFVNDPKRTLQMFPESNKSEPARYARAYRGGQG